MDRRRWRCGAWDRKERSSRSRSCACVDKPDERAMGFAAWQMFDGYTATVLVPEGGETKHINLGKDLPSLEEAEKKIDAFLADYGAGKCPGLRTVAKTPEESECRKQLRARVRGSILADVARRYASWRSARKHGEAYAQREGLDPDFAQRAYPEPCITASDLVHTDDMNQIEEEFGITGRNCMRFRERPMLVWTSAEALRKAGKLKSSTGRGHRGREVRCYESADEPALGGRRRR